MDKLQIGDIVRIHYKIVDGIMLYKNGVVVDTLEGRERHITIKSTDIEYESCTTYVIEVNSVEEQKTSYIDTGMDEYCTIDILSR